MAVGRRHGGVLAGVAGRRVVSMPAGKPRWDVVSTADGPSVREARLARAGPSGSDVALAALMLLMAPREAVRPLGRRGVVPLAPLTSLSAGGRRRRGRRRGRLRRRRRRRLRPGAGA